MNKRLLLFVTGAVSLASAQSAVGQSGGRLFMTPAMRIELERRRLGLVAPEPVIEQGISIENLIPDEPAADVIVQFGGALLSENRGNQVWLNGRLTSTDDLPEGIRLQQQTNGSSVLRVRSETGDKEFMVKAGQVLNVTQAILYESYEWDRLQQAAAAAAAALESC